MKKRALSMLLAVVMLACLVPSVCFAADTDAVEVSGSWNGRHNGWGVYEFDSTWSSCPKLSVQVTVDDCTGNPYRTWLIYVRDTQDKWTKVGSFVLNKNGETHEIVLPKAMDITAVEVQLDGGYSSTTYYLSVYSASPQPSPAPASESKDFSLDDFKLDDLNLDDFDLDALLGSYISGSFDGTYHGSGVFVLDTPLENLKQFDLYCRILEYTGNPFRKWIINGKTTSGDWVKLSSFTMDKEMYDEGQTFTFSLSKAMDIAAFSIELDGGAHTVSYSVAFSNAVTE